MQLEAGVDHAGGEHGAFVPVLGTGERDLAGTQGGHDSVRVGGLSRQFQRPPARFLRAGVISDVHRGLRQPGEKGGAGCCAGVLKPT